MEIIKKPIKNFAQGRNGLKPFLVVIHIAEGYKDSVYSTFQHEEKSSHYLVNQDGSIWQFVDEKDTAWANGIQYKVSSELVNKFLAANPKANVNSFTISIEHEGYSVINGAQQQKSVQLIKEICARWNIPIDRQHIIGHREITAYKTCPALINIDELIRLANQKEEIKATAFTSPPVAKDDTPWFIRIFNSKIQGK